MLEKVTAALHAMGGLPAITVTSALGIAVERGSYDQVAKTKLEMMVVFYNSRD
jgi:nitrogen regulatory protein PII